MWYSCFNLVCKFRVGTRSYRLSAQHYVTLNAKVASTKLGVIFKWRELCLQNMAVKDLSSKLELLDAFVTPKKDFLAVGDACIKKQALLRYSINLQM